MTIISTIIIIAVLIDFIFLLLFPEYYSYIGIPIKSCRISGYGFRIMNSVKAGLESNFKSFKFRNNDTCIWFRTKFNLITVYSIGFLSITKGIIIKNGENYKCLHVMNLSTVLFILLLIFLSFSMTIDILGMVILLVICLGLVAFTLFRNKQFDEMLKFIQP